MSDCRQAVRGLKPWIRQVPKVEASIILVSVPWWERVPPLTFLLITTGHRLRSAALLSGGAFGLSHEDEEFPVSSTGQALDVVLHTSAQPGLGRRRIIQEGVERASRRFSKASWAKRRRLA